MLRVRLGQVLRALQARRALPEQQAQRGLRVLPVQREWAQRGRRVSQGQLALRALRAIREQLVRLERQASRVRQAQLERKGLPG